MAHAALLLLLAAATPARSQYVAGIRSIPTMVEALDSLMDHHLASHYFHHGDNSAFTVDLLHQDFANDAAVLPHEVAYAEVLGVGCTPVQTLHKSLSQSNNETLLQLRVSTTCSPSRFVPLSDVSATVTGDGELIVHATPAGTEAFDQSLSLPRHADVSRISINYDKQTGTVRVLVPISTPLPISIPVSGVPAREIANTAAAHRNDEVRIETAAPAPSELAAPPSPPKETAEEAKARERAVAAQIKRLEDELARIKASA